MQAYLASLSHPLHSSQPHDFLLFVKRGPAWVLGPCEPTSPGGLDGEQASEDSDESPQ